MTLVGAPAVCPLGGDDCADTDPLRNPAAPELCDGVDNDCDDLTDAQDGADLEVDDRRACEAQVGACAGSIRPAERCVGGAWQACEPVDYALQSYLFEEAEASFDDVDNDCDGLIDEDLCSDEDDPYWDGCTDHVRGELQANHDSVGSQNNPDVAVLANGTFVVVWDGPRPQDTDGGVVMRLFDPQGRAFTADRLVNQYTTSYQDTPAVAPLEDGGFVVVWESWSQPQDTSSGSVMARLFEADGSPRTDEFLVNVATANDQEDPDVVGLVGGGFVVAWEHYVDSTALDEIGLRRFAADGTPLSAVDEIANATATGYQDEPSLAALPDGGFVVAWDDSRDSTYGIDIYARSFAADGSQRTPETLVNTIRDGAQRRPMVKALPTGSFRVVWYSANAWSEVSGNDIASRTFDASGDAVEDADVLLNQVVASEQSSPDLAMLPDGRALVAYLSVGETGGSSYDIAGRWLDAAGRPSGDSFLVNRNTFNSQFLPAVWAWPDGRVAAVWRDLSIDGDSYGVALAVLNAPEAIALTDDLLLNDDTTRSQRYSATAGRSDGSFVAAWQSWLGDGDLDSVRVRCFTDGATPVGPDFQINTWTTSYQQYPDVALTSDGGAVVAWESHSADGSIYGIRARMLTAACATSGDEFTVNVYTTSSQYRPAVSALADGGFVVVWQDTSGYLSGGIPGVAAQVYSATGEPEGSVIVVGSDWLDTHDQPDVATWPDRDELAVVWQAGNDYRGDYHAIYLAHYGRNGVKIGPDVTVRYVSGASAGPPVVAVGADDHLAVAWQEASDVRTRPYMRDPASTPGAPLPLADARTCNVFTDGWQQDPAIAKLTDGRFVVAWESCAEGAAQDVDFGGEGCGIYGRVFRYDGGDVLFPLP